MSQKKVIMYHFNERKFAIKSAFKLAIFDETACSYAGEELETVASSLEWGLSFSLKYARTYLLTL